MRRPRLTMLLIPLFLTAAGCASHYDDDEVYGPAGYYDGGAYYETPRPVDVDVEQRYYYRPYYGPYAYPGYYGGFYRGYYGGYRGGRDHDHFDHGSDHGDGHGDDSPGRERVRGDRSPLPPPRAAGGDASPRPAIAPGRPSASPGAGPSGGPHGRH